MVQKCEVQSRASFLFSFLALGFLLATLLPQSAYAAAAALRSDWQDAANARARLISSVQAVGQADQIVIGVQIQLEPGWKTYWRAAGESGAPPLFDWQRSNNLAAIDIAWPAPKRFTTFGLDSFGYHREIILPMTVTLQQTGQPLNLDVDYNYSICSEICVPVTGQLQLTIPAGPGQSAADASVIKRFAAKVPEPMASEMQHTVSGHAGEQILTLQVDRAVPWQNPDVMVEGQPFSFGRPQVLISEGGKRAIFHLPVYSAGKKPKILHDQPLRITIVDKDYAVEHHLAAPGNPS